MLSYRLFKRGINVLRDENNILSTYIWNGSNDICLFSFIPYTDGSVEILGFPLWWFNPVPEPSQKLSQVESKLAEYRCHLHPDASVMNRFDSRGIMVIRARCENSIDTIISVVKAIYFELTGPFGTSIDEGVGQILGLTC